jgi:hypothetical protein
MQPVNVQLIYVERGLARCYRACAGMRSMSLTPSLLPPPPFCKMIQLTTSNSVKSLNVCIDAPVISFVPEHTGLHLNPEMLLETLLNDSVLRVREEMEASGISLDTPLFPHPHTLLTFAVEFEPEAVDDLLQHHAVDVNAKDEYGDLPLVLALKDRALFQKLLAHPDTQINAQDGHGKTALIEAASRGDPTLVELLLKDHRLDIDAHSQGLRALDCARARRNSGIAEAIESGLMAEPRIKCMPLDTAWKLLGAEPGYYYTGEGQLVGVSDKRELTALYMERLKHAFFVDDPEESMLRTRMITRAYAALLRACTTKLW